jgi:hypothetical protein
MRPNRSPVLLSVLVFYFTDLVAYRGGLFVFKTVGAVLTSLFSER